MILAKLKELESQKSFKEGKLNLKGITFSSINDVKEFTKWLLTHKHLKSISFRGCSIGEHPSIMDRVSINPLDDSSTNYMGLLAIAANQPRGMTPTKADYIASLFNDPDIQQFEVIDFSNNQLTRIESEIIIRSIVKSQRYLRSLSFNVNALGINSIDHLAQYLTRQSCCLKYLRLQRCFNTSNSTHYIPNAVTLFTEALRNNNTLRVLDLTECKVKTEEFANLIQNIETNETIVTLIANTDETPTHLVSNLEKKLSRNRLKQKELHGRLLTKKQLLQQATSAIDRDDTMWLDVLIGLDKNAQLQLQEFPEKLTAMFFAREQASLELSYINNIIKGIEAYSKLPTIEQIQKELDISSGLFLKQSENEFNHSFKAFETELGLYLDEQSQAIGSHQALQKFRDDIIKPVSQLYSIKFEGPQDQVVSALQQQYEQTKIRLEQIKIQYQQLLTKHKANLGERDRLLSCLTKLYLTNDAAKEKEEIELALIETNLSPNDFTENETLLYYAFINNKLNAFTFLLQRGGSIVAPNADQNSVFLELVRRPQQLATFNLAIKHIKDSLTAAWPKLTEQHQQLLNDHKKIIEDYLAIFDHFRIAPRTREIINTSGITLPNGARILREQSQASLAYPADIRLLDQALLGLLRISEGLRTGQTNPEAQSTDEEVTNLITLFDSRTLQFNINSMRQRQNQPQDRNPRVLAAPSGMPLQFFSQRPTIIIRSEPAPPQLPVEILAPAPNADNNGPSIFSYFWSEAAPAAASEGKQLVNLVAADDVPLPFLLTGMNTKSA